MIVLVTLLALAATINGQTECNNARAQFEAEDPGCLGAFEGAAGLDGEAIDLVCNNTDCQTAIGTYVGACISNQPVNETVLVQHLTSMLGCIPVGVPDDTICFDAVANVNGGFDTVFSSLSVLTNSCIAEYFMGVCSDNCIQMITTLTERMGCCYSEAVRVFSSQAPNQIEADISLGILTRDYFSLCGINQPMFCQNRTIPAPSACVVAVQTLFGNEVCSTVARLLIAGGEISNSIIPDPTCIANLLAFGASCNVSLDVGQCEMSAFDLLGPNDDCANSFFTIASNLSLQGDENISFDVVDRASDNLCGVTGCRSRVSTFARNCLPTNESEMYDAFVLDVGCHTSDQGSCLAAQQSGLLTDLANAFNGGVCLPIVIFPSSDCSEACSMVIRSAVQASGCCVLEFAQATADTFPIPGGITIDIDNVFRRCGVPNPGPCTEQTEGTFRHSEGNNNTNNTNNNNNNNNNNTDNSVAGGASVIMAYTILCSLLPLLTLIII